ncbi:radical SAM protein, partial [bacterium]|nr:radical SAM protein [bacterium]
ICNFHCEHCSIRRLQGERKTRSLTMNDVRDLARQADELGLARFVITGGEPLIFPDFDDLVKAIDPQKFYINCDTNGWLLDEERAKHIKSIGVDRVQLSLDSFDAKEHDAFRRAPGAYERAMKAVDIALDAGLAIFMQTVVTKQRLYTDEFIQYIEYFNNKSVGAFVTYAKPVGAWAGNFDVLVTPEDIAYVAGLRHKYNVYDHLTPAYGLDIGCIAVKRMVSITKFGDVMPCIWMYFSLGNFFEEPLKDILQRGMKYLGKRETKCRVSEDREFIDKYVAKTYGRKDLPVPIEEIMPLE